MDVVRFYLTGEEPVERAIPPVVAKGKAAGARMLIVADEEARLDALDRALWEQCPDDYLAHGRAGAPFAERQPVLLSRDCDPANGAGVIAFADGRWRPEGETFARAFLFFDDSQRDAVRPVWSSFDARGDIAREYYAREGSRWVRRL